jgi:hypothetical protein
LKGTEAGFDVRFTEHRAERQAPTSPEITAIQLKMKKTSIAEGFSFQG